MDGKVVGLLGIGSENIVLEVKLPDGREMALRFTKRALGFHINEIPPQLTRRRIYKLEDVNQKLRSLVGNRRLNSMCTWFDDLYSKVIKIISEVGVGGLIFSNMPLDSVETIPFLMHTPGIRWRLEEFIEWMVDPNDSSSWMIMVNGENMGSD
jgi:hypothetical protein